MIINLATRESNEVVKCDAFLKEKYPDELQILYSTVVGGWTVFGVCIQSILTNKQKLKDFLTYIQSNLKITIISLQEVDFIDNPDYVGQHGSTLIFSIGVQRPGHDFYSEHSSQYRNHLPYLYKASPSHFALGDVKTFCPIEYEDLRVYCGTNGVAPFRHTSNFFSSKFLYFYLNGALYTGTTYYKERGDLEVCVLNKITHNKPTCWNLVRSPYLDHNDKIPDFKYPERLSLYKSVDQKKFFFASLLMCLLEHCPRKNRKIINFLKALSLPNDEDECKSCAHKLKIEDVEDFFKQEILGHFETQDSCLTHIDDLLCAIDEILKNDEIFVFTNINYYNQLIRLTCLLDGETQRYSRSSTGATLASARLELLINAGKDHFNRLQPEDYYSNVMYGIHYYIKITTASGTHIFSKNEILNDVDRHCFQTYLKYMF